MKSPTNESTHNVNAEAEYFHIRKTNVFLTPFHRREVTTSLATLNNMKTGKFSNFPTADIANLLNRHTLYYRDANTFPPYIPGYKSLTLCIPKAHRAFINRVIMKLSPRATLSSLAILLCTKATNHHMFPSLSRSSSSSEEPHHLTSGIKTINKSHTTSPDSSGNFGANYSQQEN